MLGRERLTVQRVDGLVVQHLEKRIQIDLPKAYARQSIPSRQDKIPRPELVNNWPHLRRIKDKILPYEENMEIGLLIDCNCPNAIEPTAIIRGISDKPCAGFALLGWSIVGLVVTLDTPSEDYTLESSCHCILAREVVSSADDSKLSFIFNGKTKEVTNPSAINQMFELDFMEHKSYKSRHGPSKEER